MSIFYDNFYMIKSQINILVQIHRSDMYLLVKKTEQAKFDNVFALEYE